MPTISDVAKLAGVSVATVSRVINQKGNVLPKAEEAVRKAIAELNYSPNSIGRNLRQLKTNRILVLQPSIANPFYSRVVRGIDWAAGNAGYHIMISDTNLDADRELEYLSMLDSHVVDGAILMTPCHDPDYYREIAARHPLVFCTEDFDHCPISTATMDNVQAGYDVANYLIGLGHQRIGFLAVYGNKHAVGQRLLGFKRALMEAGLPFPDAYFLSGISENDETMSEAASEVTKRFVTLPDRPTALFCTSDIIAIGVIRELHASGIRVPEDVSVFSFDDVYVARLYDPMLTTVYIPKFDLGCKAVELLLERLKDPNARPRREVVNHEIRVRETTRALTADEQG